MQQQLQLVHKVFTTEKRFVLIKLIVDGSLYHLGVFWRSNMTTDVTGWLNLISILFVNTHTSEQSATIYTP